MKVGTFFIKYACFLVFFMTIFTSCSRDKETIPKGIIPEEKMAEILTDIHIAEAYTNFKNLQAENLRQNISSYYLFIFKNHQVSEEDFEESFDFYSKNPNAFVEVYTQVLINISKKEAETTSH